MLVRSGILKFALSCLPLTLTMVALAAGSADAAEPTLYQLPDATHAGALAAGPGQAVWFTPSRGSEYLGPKGLVLGRIASDGTVGEVSVPSLEGIGGPVLGAGGGLWLSGVREGAAGEELRSVAKIGLTGQVEKRFTVGRGPGVIGAKAVGRDAVWFVRFRPGRRDSIERLNLSDGSLRQFALGPKCESNALALAADGTLWFTEACRGPRHGEAGPGESSIGQITPAGKVSRRPLPGRGYPQSIALGPHGTVWFGVSRSNYSAWEVGRITGAGALAEYPVPDGYPSSIGVGREGRLWFQSSFGGGIFRAFDSIGVGGHIAKPVCADPACELEPVGLTAARDGSLWFGLTKPHTIGGGGGTQLLEELEISNEAGSIGHLVRKGGAPRLASIRRFHPAGCDWAA